MVKNWDCNWSFHALQEKKNDKDLWENESSLIHRENKCPSKSVVKQERGESAPQKIITEVKVQVLPMTVQLCFEIPDWQVRQRQFWRSRKT